MKKPRYWLLDTLRGIGIIGVVAYHFLYDLVRFFGVEAAWLDTTAAYLFQQGTVFLFVFIAGISAHLTQNIWQRGLVLSLWGLVLTGLTCFFAPQALIQFGILSLLGAATLLTAALAPLLRQTASLLTSLVYVILYFVTHEVPQGLFVLPGIAELRLPEVLYESRYLFPLGLPDKHFFSADYFPLLPWLFPYWSGYSLWQVLGVSDKQRFLNTPLPSLALIGRHSLAIYLLHQPILLGFLYLWFQSK